MSKACFKFDTDGRYCVTKGKISFCVFFFPLSTEHLLVNLISDSGFFYQIAWVTSGPQMSFKVRNVFLESVL